LEALVFYRDETLRGGAQGMPVVVAGRQGHEARLFVDGAEVAHGTSFMAVALPMSRGTHSIVVKTSSGSDRVLYNVR
jgi:hypothetical protein